MYNRLLKRFLDVIVSSIAILVLSPLFVVLIVVGSICMTGNPFFVQIRPGRNDKSGKETLFRLIKFRTMTNEKDSEGNLLPDEQRLGKYGAFLRSTSLDELPELINIFTGKMSFVGPRPQLVKDLAFMNGGQRKRHSVRPGLTGLAQVNGRNSITWEKKFELDLEYIDRVSFSMDCEVFFKTIFKVFVREGVVREGTASDLDFGDWLLQNGTITKQEYDCRLQQANDLILNGAQKHE
ncbi:MAG: sugar transferase [Bacilli bacterium]|nr:sugar transferase [Bacilli bacterium]